MSKTDSSHDSDRLDELEQRLEQLEAQQQADTDAETDPPNDGSHPGATVSRRGALATLASLAALGFASGTVSAQSSTTDAFCSLSGDVDYNGYSALNVGGLQEGIAGSGNTIESLVGSGLSVDGNNNLVAGEGGSAFWTDADNDNLLETGKNGVDVGTVTTGGLSVGGKVPINYWPPVQTESIEADDASPPTSYTTVTISAAPSDATFAILELRGAGDGTADRGSLEVRQNGASRSRDAILHTWAGHGAIQGGIQSIVAMDSNNKIEYRNSDGNLSNVRITLRGYF